jgi:hypothetical protein
VSPKIDWFNNEDDLAGQPRWEPRRRAERLSRVWAVSAEVRERARRAMAGPLLPETVVSGGPLRRPLHLIWGEPHREARSADAPPGGDQAG